MKNIEEQLKLLKKLSKENNWQVLVFGKNTQPPKGVFCGDAESVMLLSKLLKNFIDTQKASVLSDSHEGER